MNTPNLISYQTLWRVCYTPKGVELMSKYRVVHRCTDYCTPSCIQRAITTLKTFFLQQQPLRKQIVWGSQPFVSCLEKLFQDFRQCSSALYLQERFCSFTFVVSVLYHHLYRVAAARQPYVRRGSSMCGAALLLVNRSPLSYFFSP